MSSTILFFIFIPLLALLLVAINFIFAPHYPYKEKDNVFECGFNSFLGQNRTQFSISFFIFALLFLLFDLEIILLYPFALSAYINDIYGLMIMLIFFIVLTLGFAFELGKKALNIESKQQNIVKNGKLNRITRDKLGLKFYTFINLIFIKQKLSYYTVQISRRHLSTSLPAIFNLNIKDILILFILFIALVYYILFFISFIYLVFKILYIVLKSLDYTYCFNIFDFSFINYKDLYCNSSSILLSQYMPFIILFFNYFLYFILYIPTSIFYRFCFTNILTSKNIIKLLHKQFAYSLTNKNKLSDIFRYLFTIKYLKYIITCWCFLVIPLAIIYINTGSFFYTPTQLVYIFITLYTSITLVFVSCFFNKKPFFSILTICNIIYIFCIILFSKLTVS